MVVLLLVVAATYAAAWLVYVLRGGAARRERIFKCILCHVSAGIGVLLLEVPALFGWIDYRQVIHPPESELFTLVKPWEQPSNRFDPELLFLHRPNLRFAGTTPGDLVAWLGIATTRRYPVDLRYDAHGFRNPRTMDRAAIVAIGDSFLEAGLVPDDEILTARLARAFSTEVANLGHGAYGPQQELIVLRRLGLPLKPEVILWFAFEGNDLLDVFRFEQFRREMANRSALSGFRARSLTDNALRTIRWATKPALTQDTAEATRRSCQLRRTDSIPPEDRRIYFAYPGLPLTAGDQRALAELQRAVKDAHTLARQSESAFMLLFIPTKFRVYSHLCDFPPDAYGPTWIGNDLPDRLAGWSREQGIDFFDLTPALQAAAGAGRLVYFADDGHWNGAGHDVVTAALIDALEQRRWMARDRTGGRGSAR